MKISDIKAYAINAFININVECCYFGRVDKMARSYELPIATMNRLLALGKSLFSKGVRVSDNGLLYKTSPDNVPAWF